jgi:hypothetical protein
MLVTRSVSAHRAHLDPRPAPAQALVQVQVPVRVPVLVPVPVQAQAPVGLARRPTSRLTQRTSPVVMLALHKRNAGASRAQVLGLLRC